MKEKVIIMFSNIILMLIINISLISCQLQILGPAVLSERMKNYFSQGSLEYELGNFGEIPYGRTVVGYIFYQSNDWCDFDKTYTPPGLEKDPDGDYSPIFLVDYSDNCSLTRQAYNVRARGGRIMLLVSKDSSFMQDKNIDDVTGNRVDIPTVIIRRQEGLELKDFIKNNPLEKAIISMKFTGEKKSLLEFEMYMKSDDIKSLHFFREFFQYFNKLKAKMFFKPYYKYYKYSWGETSDVPNAKDSSAACVTSNKYCQHDSTKLKVSNPRIILMENIRQTCIYELFFKENMDLYWNYMMNFSDTCVDLNNLMFTEDCAIEMMKFTGINADTVNQCISKTIKDGESGTIARHYGQFKNRNIHKTPEILLNGKRYKGTWLAKNIFNAICSGFLDDDSVCATPKPEELTQNDGLGVGGVLLIIVLIVLAMLILLICYKRIVNKSLEASLNEKIQTQTIHSLGQYQVMKDENTGRKTVDVSKL